MELVFRLSAVCTGISVMLASTAALAQTDAAAAATDGITLETVVVSAQKRIQSLQEVPISMTVLGEQTLEKSRIHSLYDIQQLAANFEVVQSPGWSVVSVRGVGGGGRNVGWDTRVGIYLDGVYLGQAQALGQSLNDIERIEILRGPQGHLFGRNTGAGAVSITTRAPSKEFEASVSGGFSNYGGYEAAASISGSLASSVQGKLAISGESRDGFVTNRFDGSKLYDLDRLGVRGQLSMQPNRQLTLDLYADYSKFDQKSFTGEPTTGMFDSALPGGALPHRVVNFSTSPFANSELSGLSLTINYALASGHQLTAISGYRDTRQQRRSDTDYGPLDLFRIEYADRFKQASQEIRLASPSSGSLRYVVGFYGLSEDARTDRLSIVGRDTAAVVPFPGGVMRPFAAFGVPAGAVISNSGRIKTDTAALFASLDYQFAPHWTLNLGGRYTDEKKDVLYNLDGAKSGGFRIATLNGYSDSRSEQRFTPTLGVSLAASPDLNLYAKYATGFKSGGWNTDFLSTAQVATGFKFDTETVKSVEVGAKGKLLQGSMQYELAAFASRFDNYQVFQFVNLGTTSALVLNNAAQVRTSGAEASTRVRLTRELSVSGNVGVLRAVYQHFPNGGGAGIDYSGQRLADTPRLTAALSVSYSIAAPMLGARLEMSGDYNHRGGTVLGGIFQDLPSRNLVNLRLGLASNSGHWSAHLWAKNVFDLDYVIARGRDFLGNQFDTRGQPRTFGATAKYIF